MDPRSSDALAFSSDGRLLAVSSGLGGSRHIHLWDLEKPRTPGYVRKSIWLRPLKCADTVACLDFRPVAAPPDRRARKLTPYTLAAGGHNGRVSIWDTAKRAATHRWQCGEGPVAALLYSADGALLASASQDGLVQVWRVEDRYSFVVHIDVSQSDSISPAPRLVGGRGGVPPVWMWKPFEAAQGCEMVEKTPSSNVGDRKAGSRESEDADKLPRTAADANGANIRSVRPSRPWFTLHLAPATGTDDASIHSAAESCSTLVSCAAGDPPSETRDDGIPLCVFDGQKWRIWRGVAGARARLVDVNPSGTLIAYVPAGSRTDVVAHIDALLPDGSSTCTVEVLPQFCHPAQPLSALRFSPEGRNARLVAQRADNSVTIWNVTTRQWNTWMKLFVRPIAGLAFSFTPCARYMVLVEKERKRKLLERVASEIVPVLRPREVVMQAV